ncbi:restriction endonuclease [Paenibacillus sp. FSL K6-2524]|uniref:restriction endonuclease n=1 Tax=Paenibacillus sp. FSL K6-2524 TaxID=2954516 RepID=UPI0030F80D97
MGEVIWFKEMTWFVVGFFGIVILLGVIAGLLKGTVNKKNKRKIKSNSRNRVSKSTNTQKKSTARQASGKVQRSSMICRPDEVILSRHLSDLNGAEFERLLALYFRDQGYVVKEVGVGGKDGGVDLVITDRRGEKTAVQAKCYADYNKVNVQTVRELVGAKRNHDCILSLLVTTSDLTSEAKKEADQRTIEYWHGGIIEQKLKVWGKWQPTNKKVKPVDKGQSKVAVAKSMADSSTSDFCKCGAPMVKRKNKNGIGFWGCSKFPQCRHTKELNPLGKSM